MDSAYVDRSPRADAVGTGSEIASEILLAQLQPLAQCSQLASRLNELGTHEGDHTANGRSATSEAG